MSDKAKSDNTKAEETQSEKEQETQTAEKEADTNEHTESENNADHKSEHEAALTELQSKYDTVNDKYLRLYSEFENFRRRTAKEKLDLMKNAGADVVGELLPIVDDFERAIKSNEDNQDIEAVKEGFNLIHNKLLNLLKNQGLKPMDSINETFDTEYHEAITNIPAPSDDMKGKVIDVAEKGYFFNDKVLRYAKVVVGQ